uniref:Cell death abnormality protein 1-like n=1 Tax=Crassostrea virginica TaxID=6565 RepID=A0A8B8C6L2_CRAVI|nr:cell death abnormality protein 1-like [Crassostrea virginica]
MYAVVLLVCCSWVALLCPFAQAYENLALHQPTWQSSTFTLESIPGVSNTADRAVDGQYTGECAVSFRGQTAEWRVDLGALKNIHHVFIQYATINITWDENNPFTNFFLGFSVYISNATNKENGVLCFRDTNYTNATIPNPVNITCPYHGRYIIYYNNRTHPPYPEGYSKYACHLLCEVEVYGCDVNTYGVDCKRCGNCSGGAQCDHVTGTCPNGCDPGMYGDECDRECVNKTYGMECKEQCGNCSNGEPCHHVDGSCRYGCDVGVHGRTCDEACQPGRYGINCATLCGPNCQGCNRFTGVCEFGCLPGWTGPSCEKRSKYMFRLRLSY